MRWRQKTMTTTEIKTNTRRPILISGSTLAEGEVFHVKMAAIADGLVDDEGFVPTTLLFHDPKMLLSHRDTLKHVSALREELHRFGFATDENLSCALGTLPQIAAEQKLAIPGKRSVVMVLGNLNTETLKPYAAHLRSIVEDSVLVLPQNCIEALSSK